MRTTNGIHDTEIVATYLRKWLAVALGRGGAEEFNLLDRPLEFLQELHYVVKLVAQAIQNKKQMNWSMEKYLEILTSMGKRCTGMQAHVEEKLIHLFPLGETKRIAEPCVVTDAEGIILVWFLPGLLKSQRQEVMWNSLKILQGRLTVKEHSTSWRINRVFYRSPKDCRYKPGSLSYGLAWYQQGMKGTMDLEVATELRKPILKEWLSVMEETNLLLGGVIGLIHPTTFKTGIDCILGIGTSKNIQKAEDLSEVMQIWTSPCTAASVINNQDTPIHRDNGASYGLMDCLTSVGPFTFGKFMLPSLGFEFIFKSGTVIGLLGRIVPHAAEVDGERLCYAQYLRENILGTLGATEPAFIDINALTNF